MTAEKSVVQQGLATGHFSGQLDPPLDDGFGCSVINSTLERGGERAIDGVVKGLSAVTNHFDAVLARETGDTTDATALAPLNSPEPLVEVEAVAVA